jgi:hypothetical protein
MAVILFRLRGVPEDEADEVRGVLADNRIEFYETPPGRWGISMEAIWLKDETQLERARGVVVRYQQERLLRAREAYRRCEAEGDVETLVDRIKNHPILFLLCLGMAALVGYVSVMPFLTMGRP